MGRGRPVGLGNEVPNGVQGHSPGRGSAWGTKSQKLRNFHGSSRQILRCASSQALAVSRAWLVSLAGMQWLLLRGRVGQHT